MREILFRGMLITSNEWVEGNLLVAENGQPYIFPSKIVVQDGHHLIIDSDEAFFVIPSTIGQFTGLHDRDGKRIFEGDIGISRRDDRTFIIVFENGGFHGRRIEDNPHGTVFHFTQYDAVQFTVIGNIHES